MVTAVAFFGVDSSDPWSWFATTVILATIGLAAAWLPAVRASSEGVCRTEQELRVREGEALLTTDSVI
jgi:hypothetical protein